LTSWKKPTADAAAFTWATTSAFARASDDSDDERSMTGMVTAPPPPLGEDTGCCRRWLEWCKMAGMAATPASTRPLTPALVSSNALSSLRRS